MGWLIRFLSWLCNPCGRLTPYGVPVVDSIHLGGGVQIDRETYANGTVYLWQRQYQDDRLIYEEDVSHEAWWHERFDHRA